MLAADGSPWAGMENGDTGTTVLRFADVARRLRRTRRYARATRTIKTKPPITPPTIAPTGVWLPETPDASPADPFEVGRNCVAVVAVVSVIVSALWLGEVEVGPGWDILDEIEAEVHVDAVGREVSHD